MMKRSVGQHKKYIYVHLKHRIKKIIFAPYFKTDD